MSDATLKDAAIAELKQVTTGWLKTNGQPRYPSGTAPMTTHWGKAMDLLRQISSDNIAHRDAALGYLKKTTKGYSATGSNWKLALAELAKITGGTPPPPPPSAVYPSTSRYPSEVLS